jgi:hypothetical protein
MTDFRALCAELLQELEHASAWDYQQALKDQARAALAQPEPQGPTDEELGKLLYYEFTTSTGHGERVDAMGLARAVLARWGNR